MPVNCLEDGKVLTAKIVGEVDHHAARGLMEELGRQLMERCLGSFGWT